MHFAIWYRVLGGHTHMRMNVGELLYMTLAGTLVMRNEEFEEFRKRCEPAGITFLEDVREQRS